MRLSRHISPRLARLVPQGAGGVRAQARPAACPAGRGPGGEGLCPHRDGGATPAIAPRTV